MATPNEHEHHWVRKDVEDDEGLSWHGFICTGCDRFIVGVDLIEEEPDADV